MSKRIECHIPWLGELNGPPTVRSLSVGSVVLSVRYAAARISSKNREMTIVDILSVAGRQQRPALKSMSVRRTVRRRG